MQLHEIIIEKIRQDGPIPFSDFMEMCLYYPGLGYYSSVSDKTGRKGDFYTSGDLGPAFGTMIGRQLEEMWRLLGKKAFRIVEYGAGSGFLCQDILNYLQHNEELYDELSYCIIEKSGTMRQKERMLLQSRESLFQKVSWYDSIHELPGINGCILSNELLDNLSVHRVVMEEELMEVFVDHKNGFAELLRPAGQELKDYLAELNVVLPKGFRTEINLEATAWIKEIAACLEEGYVMTIDYGYPSAELYRESRSQGTLMCYNKHTVNDCPYNHIGEQDITAHVNFSALDHWAAKYGLHSCGLTDQAHFLLGLGLSEYLYRIRMQQPASELNSRREVLVNHNLLFDMGTKFKVLIQQKGMPGPGLLGLSLSRGMHSLHPHSHSEKMPETHPFGV